MHPVDINNCLNSMVILIDTREQPSERAEKRYKSFLCSHEKQKLNYGDYSAKFLNSDNEWQQIKVAVERKMHLEELAMCFTRDRKRFEAEFERAKADGATMYLLVEDASWENLINGKYRNKFNPKAFLASLTAWVARYDLKLIFCKHEISGTLIREILYREMKQLLEDGVYG